MGLNLLYLLKRMLWQGSLTIEMNSRAEIKNYRFMSGSILHRPNIATGFCFAIECSQGMDFLISLRKYEIKNGKRIAIKVTS
jgi:hypothetical protein